MHETSYRLYTFTAGNYLSPLQNGLQTAHVVGDMSVEYGHDPIYKQWAGQDRTIIICNAGNHAGVRNCYETLCTLGQELFNFPIAIFNEDEVSMNGMTTACGVLVPEYLYEVKQVFNRQTGETTYSYTTLTSNGEQELTYAPGSNEHAFIALLKSYRLA